VPEFLSVVVYQKVLARIEKKPNLSSGTADIIESLKRTDIWLFFAWSDTRARYLRSFLGPLWLTLGTAIGAAGLGFLWSALLGQDKATVIPSITAGLVVWQLVSGVIVTSTGVFPSNAGLIRNMPLPYFLHQLQLVSQLLVNYSHNILVVVLVSLIFSVGVGWANLLVIPGLLLAIINLLWISLLVGMLSARFRDIEPMVQSLMPLLFFLTPVLYRPDQVGFSSIILMVNPLTHIFLPIREPMLGAAPAGITWVVSISMAMGGWAFTLWFFNRHRHRIPFWV
jgi:ABC-type polysaccharide/polyol phosphate export permease